MPKTKKTEKKEKPPKEKKASTACQMVSALAWGKGVLPWQTL